jgi:hypothetical protein
MLENLAPTTRQALFDSFVLSQALGREQVGDDIVVTRLLAQSDVSREFQALGVGLPTITSQMVFGARCAGGALPYSAFLTKALADAHAQVADGTEMVEPLALLVSLVKQKSSLLIDALESIRVGESDEERNAIARRLALSEGGAAESM